MQKIVVFSKARAARVTNKLIQSDIKFSVRIKYFINFKIYIFEVDGTNI